MEGLPGFGRASVATAINPAGDVTGWSALGGINFCPIHAVLWTASGEAIDLAGSPVCGLDSEGAAINARDQITGVSADHAFLWTEAGGMKDLGTLGGDGSSGIDINARGEVTGNASIADGATHAFLWAPSAGMVDLGTLGGRKSFGVAVNETGQVAGDAKTPSGATHAFLWASSPRCVAPTIGPSAETPRRAPACPV
jgi:probable HAF family extracellular repeat protein